MESTSARMGRLGRSLLLGSELLDEDAVCARIDAVTTEDVAALAAALFDPARLSVACIGPDVDVMARAIDALVAEGA